MLNFHKPDKKPKTNKKPDTKVDPGWVGIEVTVYIVNDDEVIEISSITSNGIQPA
jgi:hypothetical protein